jgi:hypothetical protein
MGGAEADACTRASASAAEGEGVESRVRMTDASNETRPGPTPDDASTPRNRPGNAAAAAVVWSWDGVERDPIDLGGLARRKRIRGVTQGLVAGALGGVMFWLGLRTPATVVWTLATVIASSALLAPTSLYAAIEHGFAALGRWTGLAFGWILLTPIFYLFFAPFGSLLRRGRRDRLQRSLDPAATSYWEPHEGMRVASDSYLRQF